MQLHKLIYFAHGWLLGIYGRPLVKEPIQAWKYGPVIPSLYHHFKKYGSRPITSMAFEVFVEDDDVTVFEPKVPATDSKVVALLDRIWSLYGVKDAILLSALSHERGGPWDKTFTEYLGQKNAVIETDSIRHFFSERAQANASERRQQQ